MALTGLRPELKQESAMLNNSAAPESRIAG
jgi:hypothetical protein